MTIDMQASDGAADLLQHVTLRVPCNAAAPLVANGARYVGCQLDDGHDGPHKVEIGWPR